MCQFNASTTASFLHKWHLRAVSRAFYCAWHTKSAWRGARWGLALRGRRHFGQFSPAPSLTARWAALLQHIAHLLPDGFLDGIKRACRPQFFKLSIDEALAEVRSFGAHVYVETLEVQLLPDEPFATHLLHEALHIGAEAEVRHATVAKDGLHLLVALSRSSSCRERSRAAHLSARRGDARALFIRQLRRATRPLHAKGA